MGIGGLYARLFIAIAVLFAILYALLVLIAYFIGYGQPIVIGVIAVFLVIVQYLISPRIVERSMRVKYISRETNPKLYNIVESLAMQANIPMPKVGISQLDIPNAFAFGRSIRDGHICVTRGLIQILNDEELQGVIGHELSHIRHRDMAVLTMLSVIPLISYFIFWSFLWQRRRNDAAWIAFVAFGIYIITNLIILYVNRVREFYADYGAVELTHKPASLASALYRITVSTSTIPKGKIKQAEGMKAFFATDPSKAGKDLLNLKQADLNMDGHIDDYEMQYFASQAKTTYSDKLLEVFSSHPHIIKRIKRLSDIT